MLQMGLCSMGGGGGNGHFVDHYVTLLEKSGFLWTVMRTGECWELVISKMCTAEFRKPVSFAA